MDVHTPEQRRRNMQAIKSKGSKAEVALASALWHAGYRYRKNNKKVFGKPDLTFAKLKIAIFVDGEYFHGFNWEVNKHRIKTNQNFWWNKIESNMRRDALVNQTLEENGWTVIRFWTLEVRNNVVLCVKQIEDEINAKSNLKIY